MKRPEKKNHNYSSRCKKNFEKLQHIFLIKTFKKFKSHWLLSQHQVEYLSLSPKASISVNVETFQSLQEECDLVQGLEERFCVMVHTFNQCWVKRSKQTSPGQPELHNETLSQETKKQTVTKEPPPHTSKNPKDWKYS